MKELDPGFWVMLLVREPLMAGSNDICLALKPTKLGLDSSKQIMEVVSSRFGPLVACCGGGDRPDDDGLDSSVGVSEGLCWGLDR